MVKFVLGMMGSSPGTGSATLSTPAGVTTFLSAASRHGIKELDTARAYVDGGSEDLLGQVSASRTFSISTKAPGFSPGSLRKDNILRNCALSLDALRVAKVDIYYFHGPDSDTPLEESCDAIGELYSQGKFESFGVSNLGPEAVRTIYDYCKEKGYCLPSVYQGAYNPLLRSSERELMPLLKELGMDFYAWGPLAGGIFARPLAQILDPEKGSRFEVMKMFKGIYLSKEGTLDGLTRLASVCEKEGISVLEADIRWLLHHSALKENDAIILGASKVEQIEDSLRFKNGQRLSDEVVAAFEALWDNIKNDPPASYYST